MNRNALWKPPLLHPRPSLSSRLHHPIYNRGPHWRHTIQRLARCSASRHLLRSRTFPLRPINRRGLRYILRLHPLIPPLHRSDPPPSMGNRTFHNNTSGGKHHLLPSTLSRPVRPAPPRPGLPRCVRQVKYSVLHGSNTIVLRHPVLLVPAMRSTCSATPPSIKLGNANLSRMKAPPPPKNT